MVELICLSSFVLLWFGCVLVVVVLVVVWGLVGDRLDFGSGFAMLL